MTALEKLLPPERIVDLKGETKAQILSDLAEVAARAPGMPAPAVVLQCILEREELLPTGMVIVWPLFSVTSTALSVTGAVTLAV